MKEVAIIFKSARTAEKAVAGIPAAARAVHAVLQRLEAAGDHDGPAMRIIVPGGWTPSSRCRAEIARLGRGRPIEVGDAAESAGACITGEKALRMADIIWPPRSGGEPTHESDLLRAMDRTARAIVAATGKPSDGIVSRWLNRPISQAVTRQVLRIPGVTPMHATLANIAIGLAMAGYLFLGGAQGLIIGAVLFQIASIADGVDGEIARATFRSSRFGAKLDSLTDAATNLAFIAGLAWNLQRQGETFAAGAGAIGLGLFALGLALLGMRSIVRGDPFTFDAAKHFVLARNSAVMNVIARIMMRDFFAALFALLVVLGQAPLTLFLFAGAVTLWLAFVIPFLFLTRRPERR